MSHKAVTYVPVDLFHCMMERLDVHCEKSCFGKTVYCISLVLITSQLNKQLKQEQAGKNTVYHTNSIIILKW
jgi:hypothetical protein